MYSSVNNFFASVRFYSGNIFSSQITKRTAIAVALAALATIGLCFLFVLRARNKRLASAHVREITHQNTNAGGKPVEQEAREVNQVGNQKLNQQPVNVVPVVKQQATTDKPKVEAVLSDEDDNRPLPEIPSVEYSGEDDDPDLREAKRRSLEEGQEDPLAQKLKNKELEGPPAPPPLNPQKPKIQAPKASKDPVDAVQANTPEFKDKLEVAGYNARNLRKTSGIKECIAQTNANGHWYLILTFKSEQMGSFVIPELRTNAILPTSGGTALSRDRLTLTLTVDQSIKFQLKYNP